MICINSSGEAVSPDNIFVHAKETDVQVENGEISFQTDKLKITLDGEEMDLYYVKSLEEKIYPERTSIVLNGMLQHNNFESIPERFYVRISLHTVSEPMKQTIAPQSSTLPRLRL